MSESYRETLRKILAPVVAGKRFILLGDSMAVAAPAVAALGASVMTILPYNTRLPYETWKGISSVRLSRSLRFDEEATYWRETLARDSGIQTRITDFDPDGVAVIVAPQVSFMPEPVTSQKRRVFGGAASQWLDIEDKTKIDKVFDAANAPRPRGIIVDPHNVLAFEKAVTQHSGAFGVVLTAEGQNSAGSGVRVLSNLQGARDMRQHFVQAGARAVRVATFCPGISGTLSSLTTPQGQVATLSPIEHIVIRYTNGRIFLAGMSNAWRPISYENISEKVHDIAANLYQQYNWHGISGTDFIVEESKYGRLRGLNFNEVNARPGGTMVLLADALSRREDPLGVLTFINALIVSHAKAWPGGMPDLQVNDLAACLKEALIQHTWIMGARAPVEMSEAQRFEETGYDVAKGELIRTSPQNGRMRVSVTDPDRFGFAWVNIDGLDTFFSEGKALGPLVQRILNRYGEDFDSNRLITAVSPAKGFAREHNGFLSEGLSVGEQQLFER